MSEQAIFIEALQKGSPEDRLAFLNEACGSNAELRNRVEHLLSAYDRAGNFLEQCAAPRQTIGPTNNQEGPGTIIGRYKLLESIGQGGMGMVFMAEQTEPVKRKVAIKLIKPGMDSAQIIARLEAERQALAVMDHPNIAKVFDAGTTDTGRPFFVMELVKGIPITTYCDEHRLTPRERIELFIPVCHAVQHAHQKGIIHRDLKPTNVLVAGYDGRPVPKVIDFGVAKALGQQLTERTLFTGFGAIIGTLEYMSPEQAEFNALDVDTRSDVYSLGVLLYELLTGTTPLTKGRLKHAAITEVLRLIREEDPPKPSTRLTESQDTLASISTQRKLDPTQLTKEICGELDWMVMKALDKDRARRYETANGLARDLERFLHGQPVEAGPPGSIYRLRKFLRRHSAPVLAGALLLLSLLAGIFGTTLGMIRATSAEKEARRAELTARRDRNLAVQAQHLADQREKLATETGWKLINNLAGYAWIDTNPRDRLIFNSTLRDSIQGLGTGVADSLDMKRARLVVAVNIFDAHSELGNRQQARRGVEDIAPLAASLREASPNDRWTQRQTGLIPERLANLLLLEGDLPAARKAYLSNRDFFQGQHMLHDDALSQRDLASQYRNLAELELNWERDHEAGIPWLERGVELLQSLQKAGDLSDKPFEQRRLAWMERNLVFCREEIPKAIEQPDTVPDDGQNAAMLLTFRGHWLARRGRIAEAITTANRLRSLKHLPALCQFEAARCYSLAAATSDETLKSQCTTSAVETLQRACEAGFVNYLRLRNDPAFTPLRGLDDFEKLIQLMQSSTK